MELYQYVISSLRHIHKNQLLNVALTYELFNRSLKIPHDGAPNSCHTAPNHLSHFEFSSLYLSCTQGALFQVAPL